MAQDGFKTLGEFSLEQDGLVRACKVGIKYKKSFDLKSAKFVLCARSEVLAIMTAFGRPSHLLLVAKRSLISLYRDREEEK